MRDFVQEPWGARCGVKSAVAITTQRDCEAPAIHEDARRWVGGLETVGLHYRKTIESLRKRKSCEMHGDPRYQKMTRMVLIFAAALTSCLAGCNESSSNDDQAGSGRGGGGGGRLRSACQLDIEKLCANEQHPKQCLASHENVLSSSCKAALEERGSRR